MKNLRITLITFLFLVTLLSSLASSDTFTQCLISNSDPNHPISSAIFFSGNHSNSSVLQANIRNLRSNSSTTPKPFLIITPTHESHVQASVTCGKRHNLQMKIRRGGHDYDRSLVHSNKPFFLLDMYNLRSVDVDVASKTTPVQRGDGIPAWVRPNFRRLMAVKEGLGANVVVAQDGSGQYKTITEALTVVPKGNEKKFVVYIKQGIYDEQVTVTEKMTHVYFIGDGPTKTKITGSLNYKIGKIKTYNTATVAIDGDFFWANNIGFENTAGPEGEQAVALRVSGDSAVFRNCRIDGFQDTLYVFAHHQFFYQCTISGTIDFIFGNAAVVFLECQIVVRKPLKSQTCVITAQGREKANEQTGIVLQNCHITAEPAYIPVKSINKAYLGRPWRNFSRTVIMGTSIDDIIDPAGWLPFRGSSGLDTLYYAEYKNNRPVSDQSRRVKWPGIKKLSPQLLCLIWAICHRFPCVIHV